LIEWRKASGQCGFDLIFYNIIWFGVLVRGEGSNKSSHRK